MKDFFLPLVQNEPDKTNPNKKEERSLHSIYRLISRAVQCLDLLDLLVYAHELPSVPQVQWDLLHNLTFSRLVVDSFAHQQIKKLITSTMTTTTTTTTHININNNNNNEDGSYQADKLALSLSRQCYLFFSNGDRLSYEGFKLAKVAAQTGDLSIKHEVGREAALMLRR